MLLMLLFQSLQSEGTIEDLVQKYALLGVPCIVLIPFFIGALKTTGWIPSGWAGVAALAVSFLVFGLAALTNYFPESAGPIGYFIGAAIVGLSAVGGYSIVDAARNKNKNTTITPGN